MRMIRELALLIGGTSIYLVQKCLLDLKGVGMKDLVSTYLNISGNVMKIENCL